MSGMPKKLDSIITINFDTLIDIINALQHKNDNFSIRLTEITNRLNAFADFKEDIDNLKYKTESALSKISDAQESIDIFSKKFMDIDKKFLELEAKVDKNEIKNSDRERTMKDLEERVIGHDNNLNNLNRVVEENVKASDKERENNIKLADELRSLDGKVKNSVDEIKDLRSNAVESIKRLEMSSETQDTEVKELEAKMNKKLNENEKKVNLVIDKMNQLHNTEHHSISPKNQGSIVNDNGDVSSRSIEAKSSGRKDESERNKESEKEKEKEEKKMTIQSSDDHSRAEDNHRIEELTKEIGRLQATMEALRLENSKIREYNEQELNSLKQRINSMNNPLDNLPDFSVINQGSQSNNQIHQVEKPVIQETIIPTSTITKNENAAGSDDGISDLKNNVKQLTSTVGLKASKEELELINQNLNKEIDSLSNRLTESLHQYDNKLKLIANISKGTGPAFDPDVLTQQLNVQIIQVLKSSGKDIIQGQLRELDLSQNDNYKKVLEEIQNHTEELNKTYESIVEIRKSLLSKQVEDNVSSLLGRMGDIETNVRKVKFDLDELAKSLEDELNPQQNESDNGQAKALANQVSLRETVNILTSKLITINDKVEKLEKKQADIHKNILSIVKQDLKNESSKLLDEFKQDLKLSIAKIEEQLREKVDRFNLAEFGQRIDNKFNSEMRRKLDRVDLNKNNSVINRKIDSLEDKISRQLVDTLIDLQMEEAPLMVKKSMAPFDRCASCNQTLPQKTPYFATSTEGNNYSKYKNTKYSVKDKLPEISNH